MKKYPVILFFIASVMPTAEDFEAAEQLGPNVKFRNASFVPAEGCLEKCDAVAGAVPKRYAKAYPSAKKLQSLEKTGNTQKPAETDGAQPGASDQDTLPAGSDRQPASGDPAKPASDDKPADNKGKPAAVVWKPNQ